MQHIWYVYIDGYTTWAIFILQITEVTLIHFGKVSRTTAIFVYNFFLELIIGDFIQSFFLSSVVCCPDRSGCTNSTEKISIPAKICLSVSFCSLGCTRWTFVHYAVSGRTNEKNTPLKAQTGQRGKSNHNSFLQWTSGALLFLFSVQVGKKKSNILTGYFNLPRRACFRQFCSRGTKKNKYNDARPQYSVFRGSEVRFQR